MAIPYKEFQAAGSDIGAGLTETFLNRFSVAHFKATPSLYGGKQRFDNFDKPILITFKVNSPISFDLSPIPQSKFQKLWFAHLKAKGSPITTASAIASVPPNLEVVTKRMSFEVAVLKSDGTIDFSVDFTWDMKARCGVLLVDLGGNKRAIRLDPLKIEFSQSQSQIEQEIRGAIQKTLKQGGKQSSSMSGNHDEKWCIKLEKLFLFIINQVLAIQLANFLKAWELPRAIELVQGISVSPSFLEIKENSLLVGGQIISARALNSDLTSRLDGFMREFRERFDAEFKSPDFDPAKWNTKPSPAYKWLKDTADQLERDAKKGAVKNKGKARSDENLFLLSNDRLFDQLAKVYLNTYRSEEFASPEFLGFRAVAGWWFKVDGAFGQVVPGGVSIGANIGCGGHAGVDVRNIWDPKHWGQWEHLIDLCIRIIADPKFGIAAYPEFRNDGIYLRAWLENPKQLDIHFCGNVPGVIPAKLIEWILALFSRPLLDVIRIFIALFAIKIADYPNSFPGTALPWNPHMNTKPNNNGPYLTFSADSTFN